MNRSHDVVVVGGRAAGAATAMLLAREGLDVAMYERASYGADTTSSHALMRPAVIQLEKWGVLDRVIAAGTPPVGRVVFHYGERAFPVELDPEQPLYAPRRTVIDPILGDAAAESGVETRFGTRVLDLIHDRGSVAGVVADLGDGPVEVRARVVIGADGIRSLVARRAGAATNYVAPHAAGFVLAYVDGDFDRDAYHWNFVQHASAGAIATNDATVLFAGVSMQRFRDEVRGDIAAAMPRVLKEVDPDLAARFVGARQIEPLRSFVGEPSFMRQAGGPGWALVGDAGVFTDPMSAHGMTSAFRDAELCAAAALSHLEGSTTEQEAWRQYGAERDEIARPLIDIVDDIVAYVHPLELVEQRHLALSRLMKQEARAVTARTGAVAA